MSFKPVMCTANTSKTLAYKVGGLYPAEPISGGLYRIIGDDGRIMLAYLDGHYVKFKEQKVK